MIQLTRLQGSTFFLNPDLVERVDTHVDTVVRLTDGTEYVVVEPGAEIVRKIVEFRAQIIVIASMLQAGAFVGPDSADQTVSATTRAAGELPAPKPDTSNQNIDHPSSSTTSQENPS